MSHLFGYVAALGAVVGIYLWNHRPHLDKSRRGLRVVITGGSKGALLLLLASNWPWPPHVCS